MQALPVGSLTLQERNAVRAEVERQLLRAVLDVLTEQYRDIDLAHCLHAVTMRYLQVRDASRFEDFKDLLAREPKT